MATDGTVYRALRAWLASWVCDDPYLEPTRLDRLDMARRAA